MNSDDTKKSVLLYILLAFGLPLICVLLIQYVDPFRSGVLHFILYGIEAMTPTLSALIVTLLLGGNDALRAFLKKCYFDNIKLSHVILAIILPTTILTLTKLTSYIFTTPLISGISSKHLIIVLWALITEELGWRGFLQEKLDRRFGYIITPLILGGIWSLWHYHFFLSGTNTAPFLLFTLGCIAESYSYYWLTRLSKGNVIPASIWHFTGNLWIKLYLINPEYNQGSVVPYLLFVLYTTIIAACLTSWGIQSAKKNLHL